MSRFAFWEGMAPPGYTILSPSLPLPFLFSSFVHPFFCLLPMCCHLRPFLDLYNIIVFLFYFILQEIKYWSTGWFIHVCDFYPFFPFLFPSLFQLFRSLKPKEDLFVCFCCCGWFHVPIDVCTCTCTKFLSGPISSPPFPCFPF